MKKVFLTATITLFIYQGLTAQSTRFAALKCNSNNTKIATKENLITLNKDIIEEETEVPDDYNFSINGKSDFNKSSINTLNGSAKIDADLRVFARNLPNKAKRLNVKNNSDSTIRNTTQQRNKIQEKKDMLWVSLGFNKNASNDDSAILASIIFQDQGQNAIHTNINYTYALIYNDKTQIMLGGAYDFSLKTFTRKDSLAATSYSFNNFNHIFSMHAFFVNNNNIMPMAIGITPNFAWHNIANQDTNEAAIIYGGPGLGKGFFSTSVKLEIVLNNKFSIYGDMRSLYGKNFKSASAERYRPFQYTIGASFSTPLFSNNN